MGRKIIAILLATLLALSIVPFLPSISNTAGETMRVQASGGKLIALTFDDGSSPYTGQLLDCLKRNGGHATFFMNGANGTYGLTRYNYTARMVEEGHQLANHTWSHTLPFASLNVGRMSTEISSVASYLYAAMGGVYQQMVRIPGGGTSSNIKSVCEAPIIMWNVDTQDYKETSAAASASDILSHAADGAVFVLHDRVRYTVQAMERVIPVLRSQGYELVTVSEMFRRKGISLSNHQYYHGPSLGAPTIYGSYSAPEVSQTASTTSFGVTDVTATSPDGLTLHYTKDGSYPKLNDPVLTRLSVSKDTTLTIVGYDGYGERSPMTQVTVSATASEAIFNAEYYVNKYPDLAASLGNNSEALMTHYVNCGIPEHRQASASFDLNYYINNYADLRNAFADDNISYIQHFINMGMDEGRQASNEFDFTSYYNANSDLRLAFGSNKKLYYIHYNNYGWKEGRTATGVSSIQNGITIYGNVDYSAVYDYSYYTSHNPDVVNAIGWDDTAVLSHFVNCGMKEGRRAIASFDVQSYRRANSDLRAAYGTNLKQYYLHYISYGKREGRRATGVSGLLNPTTTLDGVDYSAVYDFNDYMDNYADLKALFADDDVAALRHFVSYGMKEGRIAKKGFDVKSYKNSYADLRGMYGSDYKNYYIHYMYCGKNEGRNSTTNVKTVIGGVSILNGVDYSDVYDYQTYIALNPDIKSACGGDDILALKHFVLYGMKEGRIAKNSFNPYHYRDRYADVRSLYGNNMKFYYIHYMACGKKENRNGR